MIVDALKTRVTNTKERGGIVHFVYITSDKGSFGICLDFDITEEGSSELEVRKNLETAVALHIETVRGNNLSDDLLNRLAPKEYWDIYNDFHSHRSSDDSEFLRAERVNFKGALPLSC